MLIKICANLCRISANISLEAPGSSCNSLYYFKESWSRRRLEQEVGCGFGDYGVDLMSCAMWWKAGDPRRSGDGGCGGGSGVGNFVAAGMEEDQPSKVGLQYQKLQASSLVTACTIAHFTNSNRPQLVIFKEVKNSWDWFLKFSLFAILQWSIRSSVMVPFVEFLCLHDGVSLTGCSTTRECGFFHTTSCSLWHMCEVNFVVSSVTMYNLWCLLWHILH